MIKAGLLTMVLIATGCGKGDGGSRAKLRDDARPALAQVVPAADGAVPDAMQDIEPGEPPPSMVVVTSEPAFYIDRTEVTIGAYRECVAANVCKPPEAARWKEWDAKRAVTMVSPEMARAYCAYRGKRLPTQKEWMRAALGEDGRKFPWGNEAASCQIARVGRCARDVSNVGTMPRDRSPYGALDMGGNVLEFADEPPFGRERRIDATVMGAEFFTPLSEVAAAFEGGGRRGWLSGGE